MTRDKGQLTKTKTAIISMLKDLKKNMNAVWRNRRHKEESNVKLKKYNV